MRDDYRVPPLDLLEVWHLAKAQRSRLVGPDTVRFDPLSLSDVNEIWTVRGQKAFQLEFVADALLGDAGRTIYDDGKIHIKLPEHVRHRALIGDVDARFIIVRELGRSTLFPDALVTGANKRASLIEQFVRLPPTGARSAAWQAGTFAAAFLIHDENRLAAGFS